MWTFTLRGYRLGAEKPVSVTWTDGHLWGDPDAIAMVLCDAQAHEGQPLHMAGGLWTHRNHLRSPSTAYELMTWVFWGRPEMIGRLPPLPPVPPGAIR